MHWWEDEAKLEALKKPQLLALLDRLPAFAAKHSISAEQQNSLRQRLERLLDRPTTRKPANGPRNGRSLGTSVDARIARELGDVGIRLRTRYDVSPETAKANSVGVKGFRARKFVGAGGEALVGGSQLAGKTAIDRYIAYSRGEHTVTLAYVQFKDETDDQGRYLVLVPKAMTNDGQPLTDFVQRKDERWWPARGEQFQFFCLATLDDAAKIFESFLAKLAPLRPSN
jgi:hypothetical protein